MYCSLSQHCFFEELHTPLAQARTSTCIVVERNKIRTVTLKAFARYRKHDVEYENMSFLCGMRYDVVSWLSYINMYMLLCANVLKHCGCYFFIFSQLTFSIGICILSLHAIARDRSWSRHDFFVLKNIFLSNLHTPLTQTLTSTSIVAEMDKRRTFTVKALALCRKYVVQ